MDFYFVELGNAILVGFAIVVHGILSLLGVAAIAALTCYVSKFVIVDLSPGKRKLVLAALITVDVVLVIAGIVATPSLLTFRLLSRRRRGG